jgi:hypothetical protein
MPALGGKAEAFRFVYASQTWTMMARMSLGMYYAVPMVALFYFMSTQHQVAVTYYMFVYYFTGNIIFGMIISAVVLLAVDTPIQSALNFKEDVRDAIESNEYEIERYIDLFDPTKTQSDLMADSIRGSQRSVTPVDVYANSAGQVYE